MVDGQFIRVIRRKEVLALSFGAMIGWSWVALTGGWIDGAGSVGAMSGLPAWRYHGRVCWLHLRRTGICNATGRRRARLFTSCTRIHSIIHLHLGHSARLCFRRRIRSGSAADRYRLPACRVSAAATSGRWPAGTFSSPG